MGTGAPSGWRRLAGLFLLSMATLLLELSITRVLSVALWYHFGFLAISTALLGFSASGVLLALWRWLREDAPLDQTLAVLAAGFAVLTVAAFWLMQHIPFDPFSLFNDPGQLLYMPAYYVLIASPFASAGLAVSLILTRARGRVSVLYAFDLIGAGAGSTALALVMPALGGSGSVVAAAAMSALAAVVFSLRAGLVLPAACAALAVSLCAFAPFATRALPIAVTANKSHPHRPPISTVWTNTSRLDVYESVKPDPDTGRRSRTILFDAGAAATGMIDLSPGVRQTLPALEPYLGFTSEIAYLDKRRPSVLVIGSGAGQEVLDALHHGASSVTAVEVEGAINEMIRGRMHDFWGNLYTQPEVKVVTDEGRSFVRRSRERYDAIVSAHTISNAAIASGALSLAENYVLTREAFDDDLDHLKPDGVLYFTRPEAQIGRLVATGRAALADHGVNDAAAHVIVYRYAPGRDDDPRRPSFSAGFLLKLTPFTAAETAAIGKHLGVGRPSPDPSQGPAQFLYTPADAAAHTSLYARILTARDPQAFYASQDTLLAPATDDRPFFNQHTRWLRIGLGTIVDLFSQGRAGRDALEDKPVAEVTLLVLLVQAAAVAAVLTLLPLLVFARGGVRTAGAPAFMVYFAGLGLGFIMIEIALLQRFTLFLGEPVYTYAVVLAALLMFTGVGSALCAHPMARRPWALIAAIGAMLVMLAALALFTPSIFAAALGWPLPGRIALSIVLLAPLGVLLGTPFPLGLKIVAAEAPQLTSWAWSVNGFFTVIGSVAALILGMMVGFRAVLLLAGLGYGLAFLSLSLRRQPN